MLAISGEDSSAKILSNKLMEPSCADLVFCTWHYVYKTSIFSWYKINILLSCFKMLLLFSCVFWSILWRWCTKGYSVLYWTLCFVHSSAPCPFFSCPDAMGWEALSPTFQFSFFYCCTKVKKKTKKAMSNNILPSRQSNNNNTILVKALASISLKQNS